MAGTFSEGSLRSPNQYGTAGSSGIRIYVDHSLVLCGIVGSTRTRPKCTRRRSTSSAFGPWMKLAQSFDPRCHSNSPQIESRAHHASPGMPGGKGEAGPVQAKPSIVGMNSIESDTERIVLLTRDIRDPEVHPRVRARPYPQTTMFDDEDLGLKGLEAALAERRTVEWLMSTERAPDAQVLLAEILNRPARHQAAACRGADPNLFFPERGQTVRAAVALTYCESCQARAQCLDSTVQRSERVGVWGGTTGRSRKRLRLRRSVA